MNDPSIDCRYPPCAELKPCPFCGGQAYLRQVGNEFTKKRGFDVGCKSCRVNIKDRALVQSLEWLRPKTIQRWNLRAVVWEMVEVGEEGWKQGPDDKVIVDG